MVAASADDKRARDAGFGRSRTDVTENAPIEADELPRKICQFAALSPADRVLDVPCSDGALVFEMAPSCGYAVGVDSSEAKIADAATRNVEEGLDNTSFQVGSAETLEFDDGTFDRVVCWDGLHHFAEPALALGELTRVLRSPGYLTVVDIDASEDRGWRETHDRIERSRDPGHGRLLTRVEVRELLEDRGLSIERERRWRVHRTFEEWMETITPDEGTLERTHRMLTEAARKKSTGLEISVKGRNIDVIHRMAGWMALKIS